MKVRNKISEIKSKYNELTDREESLNKEIENFRIVVKITDILIPITCLILILILFSLSGFEGVVNFYDLLEKYPNQLYLFVIVFLLFIVVAISNSRCEHKISKFKDHMGLSRDEILFIKIWDIHENINLLLSEDNINRKLYFRELSLKNADEAQEIINSWSCGNLEMIIYENAPIINTFKDIFKKLVIPNIAKGNLDNLKKLIDIMYDFSEYLLESNLEKLIKINSSIISLPLIKYRVFTRKEKILNYFYMLISGSLIVSSILKFIFGYILLVVVIFLFTLIFNKNFYEIISNPIIFITGGLGAVTIIDRILNSLKGFQYKNSAD